MQNETLKAAGCCAATLVVRSMQPSEYKLRFTRPVSVEEARRLLGVTEKEWPLGTVSREVSGGAEHFEVELQDVIGALKVTPYVGKPDFSDVPALRSRFGNIPKLAKIGLLLEALGLRCRGEIETPVPVPTLSGGEMVWDVVQQMMRWLPGSTSRCMGGEVMVNCAARHNGTLTLASTGGTLLTETEQRVLTEEAHAATATLSLEETWCGKAVATGLHIGGQEVAVSGVSRTAAQEAARAALVEAINAAENGVVATPDITAPNRVLLRAKACGTDGNNVPLDYTGDAPCEVRLSGEQLAGGNVLVLEGEHASATLRPAENKVSIIVDGVAVATVTRSGGAAAAAVAINAKQHVVQYTEIIGKIKYERRTRVVARADEEDPYLLHVGVEDTGPACNGISLAVAGAGAECNGAAMSGGKDSSELSPAVNATLYLQAKSSSAWARTTNSTNYIAPMYNGGNIGWPGMLSGATATEFAESLQGYTSSVMQTQIVCDVLSPTLLKMTVVVGDKTQRNTTAEFANKMGLMFHGNIGNYFTLTDMQGNDSNVAMHCSGGRDAVLADDATAAEGHIHLAAGQLQIGEEVFEEKDLTALDGASWAESIESRSARFSATWNAEAGTLTLTARKAGAEGNVRIIPAPSLQGDEELSGGSADVVATERAAGGWVQQHWGWADRSPQPLRLFIGGRQIELREACVSKADTLAALSTAINAADCGVTASLLSDTALLLTADMVGEAGNVVSLDAGRGLIASGSHLGGGDAETAATAVLRFDSTLGWLFVGGRGAGFAIAGYDIFLPRFTSVEAVVAAINSGEAFCAGDAFEPPVVASIAPEHEGRVVLTARKPGLEGNAITLLARAIAAAGTSISAATLTGGEEGYATGWVESDNWTTFCSEPSGLRIAGIELRSWWNATPSDFAATITAAGLGVIAEAQADGRITLQAVEAGESGNAITLTCTPGGGITPSGNTLAGGAEAVYTAQYAGTLQQFGYDGGLMRLNTQERTDLVASAVGVYGRYNYVTPAGETLHQPRAIATYVPPGTLVSSMDAGNTQSGLPEGWVPLLQLACGQWETIRGLGVPSGWQLNGSKRSMLTPVGNADRWKKFWKAFAPTQRLADIANLQFGTATFEPVAASDAFHTEGGSGLADENADAVPANYRALTDGNIYVLTDGSFPASDKATENLNGLLWCRGVLRQWVWITQAQTSAKVTLEDLCEMFSGTVKIDGKTYHAAALQVEAVFINRRRLRYQTGTNQSDNSTPEVTEQPGVSGDSEELVFADYKAACDALYESAKTLYTDASATVSFRQASDLPDLRLFAGVNFDNAGDASPIREISFDLFTRHMNISSGSPERLHMSEWLERRRLGHSLSLKALGSALLGGGN